MTKEISTKNLVQIFVQIFISARLSRFFLRAALSHPPHRLHPHRFAMEFSSRSKNKADSHWTQADSHWIKADSQQPPSTSTSNPAGAHAPATKADAQQLPSTSVSTSTAGQGVHASALVKEHAADYQNVVALAYLFDPNMMVHESERDDTVHVKTPRDDTVHAKTPRDDTGTTKTAIAAKPPGTLINMPPSALTVRPTDTTVKQPPAAPSFKELAHPSPGRRVAAHPMPSPRTRPVASRSAEGQSSPPSAHENALEPRAHDAIDSRALFEDMLAIDLVRGRKVFACVPTATISNVASLLTEQGLSAAPVIAEDGTPHGIIDFLGICELVDAAAPPHFVAAAMACDQSSAHAANEAARTDVGRLASMHVGEYLREHATQAPMSVFPESTPMTVIIEHFLGGGGGPVHNVSSAAYGRVMLVDADRRVTGFIAPSDIVRYIYQNIDCPRLRALKSKTLRELEWHSRPLLYVVPNGASLKDAVRTLLRANGSAVPVVSPSSGELLYGMCPRDIAGFFATGAGQDSPFSHEIAGYLERTQKNGDGSNFPPPRTCTWDTSMVELFRMLVLGKCQHVWLLGSDRCPAGLIDWFDVLRIVHDAHGKPHQGA
jgi:CBS domain-containing protein